MIDYIGNPSSSRSLGSDPGSLESWLLGVSGLPPKRGWGLGATLGERQGTALKSLVLPAPFHEAGWGTAEWDPNPQTLDMRPWARKSMEIRGWSYVRF